MNFLYIFSLYLPFQLYLHPLHKEGKIWRYLSSSWFGLFNRKTRCQIEKGFTARVRLPAILIDRQAKARLKGEKLEVLRLHLEENLWIQSYKLCSKCKPKWQRQANEFQRWNRSLNNICAITPYSWSPNLRSGLFGWRIVRLLRRWRLFGHWTPRSGY